MHKSTYAISCIKHCVRRQDLAGKSAVILFRRVHPELIERARKLEVRDLCNYFDAALTMQDVEEGLRRGPCE